MPATRLHSSSSQSSSRPPSSLPARGNAPPPRAGLVVQTGSGFEQLLLSDRELTDDVMPMLAKLRAATARDSYGRKWKQRRRKHGVELFELERDPQSGSGSVTGNSSSSSSSSSTQLRDGDEDPAVAHALLAKTELRCHLNEVLNVLTTDQSPAFDSTMRALCGTKRVKDGRVLFHQRRSFQSPPAKSFTARSASNSESRTTPPRVEGAIGVQLLTLRPKLRVKLQSRHRRVQKLVFASCTQRFPSEHRACHVMKTLPLPVHEQMVAVDDSSALRGGLDHLALGFDIRSTPGGYGSSNHATRVLAYAYAATVPSAQYQETGPKTTASSTSTSTNTMAMATRREPTVMNPQAQHVLDLLAKSLRQFESVIRRRRFGFQSFVYLPPSSSSSTNTSMRSSSSTSRSTNASASGSGSSHASTTACAICFQSFSLFRRDLYCQLCGHLVCAGCSRMCEVEARVGLIRKNRCCVACIVRVDACVFEEADLLEALGPIVVDVESDAAWLEDSTTSQSSTERGLSSDLDLDLDVDEVSAHELDKLTAQLSSANPQERAHALAMLGKMVSPTHGNRVARHGLERHVNQSLRPGEPARKLYGEAAQCAVYGAERDYAYAYDPSRTNAHDVPLAPAPDAAKETKRLQYLRDSKVLTRDFDREALHMVAQIATERLHCAYGFISVMEETESKAVGWYEFPAEAHTLPRDESLCAHNLYAETPLIAKNPQRDMRFARMGGVQGAGVKFYAGFPVVAHDGSVVASLCACDVEPHHNITTKEYATMKVLAQLAADIIAPASRDVAPARV